MKPVSIRRGTSIALILLIPVLFSSNVFSQDPDPNFHIYLAFGQSNMEGFPNTVEEQDRGVDSRFQLLPAVDWPDGSRKKGEWTTAEPPLCRNNTGLCPCDYFGRTLVENLPEAITVGIINVAVAGCAIEMFDKDKDRSYIASQPDWMKNIDIIYDNSPYGRLVEMGQLAQNDGVIKGILLHQGESGSTSGDWKGEVKKIYNNLIYDLNLDPEKTPLLAGDLANPNPGNPSMVWGLPGVLDNSYVISSQGIEVGSNPHFSSKGYRDFGKRYADTMLAILGDDVVKVTNNHQQSSYVSEGWITFDTRGSGAVSFTINKGAQVAIKAFTLGGKEIANIADRIFTAGNHTVAIGSSAIPNGVFVLRVKAGTLSATRTVMVHTR